MKKMKKMKIAVIGTFEASLTKLYSELKSKEKDKKIKIDLVLICGNWVSSDFDEYYHGKRRAPFLTLVVGGNQEISNYFKIIPYGGFLCTNIYFMEIQM